MSRSSITTAFSRVTLAMVVVVILLLHHHALCFTNEPPGRDPASVDKVRGAERAVSLTSDNFDELTNGKLVFIKLYSPHCPHCKEMANAWNELADYYQKPENNQNDDILIASIDCTKSPGGKKLCVKFKVRGVPTILYGDASLGGIYLEEYPSTQKTFQDFQQFASINLIPKCNPANLDACAANERTQMESYIAMSYQELDTKIKQAEKEEDDTKAFYKSEFDTLQNSYNKKLEEKTKYVSKVKDDVRIIKEVLVMKKG